MERPDSYYESTEYQRSRAQDTLHWFERQLVDASPERLQAEAIPGISYRQYYEMSVTGMRWVLEQLPAPRDPVVAIAQAPRQPLVSAKMQRAIELVRQGAYLRDAANEAGVSYGGLCMKLVRLGVERKRAPSGRAAKPPSFELLQAVELVKSGKAIHEAADAIGLPEWKVRSLVKKLGVKTQDQIRRERALEMVRAGAKVTAVSEETGVSRWFLWAVLRHERAAKRRRKKRSRV